MGTGENKVPSLGIKVSRGGIAPSGGLGDKAQKDFWMLLF